MLQLDSIMENLYSQLEYSTGEIQALQLIDLSFISLICTYKKCCPFPLCPGILFP